MARGAGNPNNKNVNIKLSADTKEALRAVKELERQVNKIGDMADQGEKQQSGFLSTRQVQLYRKMLSEIEKTYQQHYSKLNNMEQDYQRKSETIQREIARRTAALNNAKKIDAEVMKRQTQLDVARGGNPNGQNRWGNVASPRIQAFYERKLKEAEDRALKLGDKGVEYNQKRLADSQGKLSSLTSLGAEIGKLKEAVRDMNDEKKRLSTHSDRINDLREVNPKTRHMIQGTVNSVIATMGVTSASKLFQYVDSGIDKVRSVDAQGSIISRKVGTYAGGRQDQAARKQLEDLGVINGFNQVDTNQLAANLLQGGTSGNKNALYSDINNAQRFGNAYAVDPNSLAQNFTFMRKMGAMQEGDMKKLADYIGGEVSANKMSGREEEVMRSVGIVMRSVSQGVATLTTQRVAQGMAVQTTIGQAIPALKGERAAEIYSTMDDAVRNGDNRMDILLGKGLDPSLKGPAGAWRLKLMKAQGATPDNLRRVLTNMKGLTANGNSEDNRAYRNNALSELFHLSPLQIEEMDKSGLLDRLQKGDTVSPDELQRLGGADTQNKLQNYMDNTLTFDRTRNDANADINKTAAAQGVADVADASRTGFNSLPQWMRTTMLYGGGMLTGPLMYKYGRGLINKGIKMFTPTIGGGGGLWNGLRGMFGGGAGPSGPVGPGGLPISATTQAIPNASKASWLARNGKWLAKGGIMAAEGLGTGIVGGYMSDYIDHVAPVDQRRQALGNMADGIVNPDKNATVNGKKIADQGYFEYLGNVGKSAWNGLSNGSYWSEFSDRMFGNKKSIDKIEAKEITLKDNKSMSDTATTSNKSGFSMDGQGTLHVVVSGKIEGMTDENQGLVAKSIANKFGGYNGWNPFAPKLNFGLDLSKDQSRK